MDVPKPEQLAAQEGRGVRPGEDGRVAPVLAVPPAQQEEAQGEGLLVGGGGSSELRKERHFTLVLLHGPGLPSCCISPGSGPHVSLRLSSEDWGQQ